MNGGFYHRLSPECRKATFIKVRVTQKMADRLKAHGHASDLIRRLLEDYFEVDDRAKKEIEELDK